MSALAAGLVERAPLSFPMLFLGLGFVVGNRGLGLISIGLGSRLLEVVAIVTLALVLFLDAVNLELTELCRDWLAPVLVLGPGTLLVIGLLAGLGMLLLDLPWSWRCCWGRSWPPPTRWYCATCSATCASPGVDQRFHIRREYQSRYGIGLVLGAFVVGEAAGGDGFLAAFAAGLA